VRPVPPVVDLARRRRPRWVSALAAAAAAAVFFGGGAAVWQATHDSAPANPADSVIQARDAAHVTVDLGGGVSATVYRSLIRNRAAIVTRRMPLAPEGRVYQLWFEKDGRMISAGVMKKVENQVLLLDGSVDDATAVGITVEPEGGSTEPTTDPVVVFDLEKAT
jgi:anti-sigma-K factor RskA